MKFSNQPITLCFKYAQKHVLSPSTKDAEMSKRVTLKDFWILKETEPVKKKAKQRHDAIELTETIDRVADVTSRTLDLDDNEAEKLNDSVTETISMVTDQRAEPDKETGKQCENKKKCDHTFQKRWLTTWPWIETSSGSMKCTLCMKHRKDNVFTQAPGCTNFRTTTLERHVKSVDHVKSVRAESLSKDYQKVCTFINIFVSEYI